ncbi:thiamine diphosphokinase [Bacillus pinisoli]|uniref:thiamine diphosphokinase n=1 Tax=Bacillus pinisoli TaxID=2901866 RepID=UPI001FF56E08|nr:thiamine diphosphokinase [Bacillus pinisoli]
MIIHIVAGGPEHLIPDLSKYTENEIKWVGVDRGLLYSLKRGIVPAIGIGDFDSVSEEELSWLRQQCEHLAISPAEKDQTDIELALDWAIIQKPTLIRLFGVTGGRLDHSLATIQLLVKGLSNQIEVELIDQQNVLSLYEPGTYKVYKELEYRYISFLPFSEKIQGMTLSNDFKYPLADCDLTWGTSLCVSNELIQETGTFSFNHGIVIMVKSKD